MTHGRGLPPVLFALMNVIAVVLTAATPVSRAWAPNQETYLKQYELETSLGSHFLKPVVGPSSPNAPFEPNARMWLIIAQTDGLIQMDYADLYSSPFNLSHQTISLRIQDLDLSFPLSNVIYIVPGRTSAGSLGPDDDLSRSGLLAFVANGRLVLLDPFTGEVHLNRDIGFQPYWFGEDPVSAGEMYDFPLESGVPPSLHTYRYIFAANDTHLTVFRVNFRSNFDNPMIPASDGIVQLISEDMNVTQEPLAFYIQVHPERSGIFVPTSNNTMSIFSIDGSRRTNMTLVLGGEPAYVSAPIGYCRAPETQKIFIPLRSNSSTGIRYVTPVDVPSGDVRLSGGLQIDEWNAVVDSAPDSGSGQQPYFTVGHGSGRTDFLRGATDTGLDPTFDLQLPSRVESFFYSPVSGQVFALDHSGTIWASWTATSSIGEPGWVDFSSDGDTSRHYMMYLGAWSGAKYGALLMPGDIYGLGFTHISGTAIVFKLIPMPVSDGGGNQPVGDAWAVIAILIVAVATTMVVVIIAVLVAARRKRPEWPMQPPI